MVNALKKSSKFAGVEGPLVTIVMDGVGLAKPNAANAVHAAHTPTLDYLMKNYPMVGLRAHGIAVGLPSDDDMGNSEVGHNALGAGQVFAQGAKLVSQSIESGKMFAPCAKTCPAPSALWPTSELPMSSSLGSPTAMP